MSELMHFLYDERLTLAPPCAPNGLLGELSWTGSDAVSLVNRADSCPECRGTGAAL